MSIFSLCYKTISELPFYIVNITSFSKEAAWHSKTQFYPFKEFTLCWRQNCCFPVFTISHWLKDFYRFPSTHTSPHIPRGGGKKWKWVTMSSDFMAMSRGALQGWAEAEFCQGMVSLLLGFLPHLGGSQETLEDKSHLPTQHLSDRRSALVSKSACQPLSTWNYA